MYLKFIAKRLLISLTPFVLLGLVMAAFGAFSAQEVTDPNGFANQPRTHTPEGCNKPKP